MYIFMANVTWAQRVGGGDCRARTRVDEKLRFGFPRPRHAAASTAVAAGPTLGHAPTEPAAAAFHSTVVYSPPPPFSHSGSVSLFSPRIHTHARARLKRNNIIIVVSLFHVHARARVLLTRRARLRPNKQLACALTTYTASRHDIFYKNII